MVTEKTLERINELYHKSKAEGLTDAELAEQKQLRAEYVKAFRENLRGQLESIKIKNPDGSLIDVKARHDEKMKRLSEEQAEKGKFLGMYNTNTSNGGFVMSEKIYLKIDQQRCVKKPKVTIGDVMTVYCSDKDMIEKIGHI